MEYQILRFRLFLTCKARSATSASTSPSLGTSGVAFGVILGGLAACFGVAVGMPSSPMSSSASCSLLSWPSSSGSDSKDMSSSLGALRLPVNALVFQVLFYRSSRRSVRVKDKAKSMSKGTYCGESPFLPVLQSTHLPLARSLEESLHLSCGNRGHPSCLPEKAAARHSVVHVALCTKLCDFAGPNLLGHWTP